MCQNADFWGNVFKAHILKTSLSSGLYRKCAGILTFENVLRSHILKTSAIPWFYMVNVPKSWLLRMSCSLTLQGPPHAARSVFLLPAHTWPEPQGTFFFFLFFFSFFLLVCRFRCLVALSKEKTYLYGKRDLLICQKRPTYLAKETYLYGKRDLLIWQKRPTYLAKETYLRPTYLAKETYLYVKRKDTGDTNISEFLNTDAATHTRVTHALGTLTFQNFCNAYAYAFLQYAFLHTHTHFCNAYAATHTRVTHAMGTLTSQNFCTA